MNVESLFAWPVGLPALLLAPLLWWSLRMADRVAIGRLSALAGPRLSALSSGASRGRRRIRRTLFSLGALMAVLAAAQPLWGRGATRTVRRGVDLVVCLDVSRSMLARDEAPNRLDAARREVRALAKATRGDRIALVAFAGEARLLVPLTSDVDSFAQMVSLADTLALEVGGSDLGLALETALGALSTEAAEDARDLQTIVLLTDGDDLAGSGLRVAERCRNLGVTVHCVGIGSTRGSKIPVPAAGGGEEFLKDEAGADVITAMDRGSLTRMAEAAGGAFVEASAGAAPLVSLYDDEIVGRATEAFEAQERSERENRFQWPLAVAIVLLMLDLCLPDTRRGASR